MDFEKSSYWFIIHSKPKQEFLVEKNLMAQGICVYLPVFLKKVKKKKEKTEIINPLFSGYLFARFDIEKCYHSIRYTKGVKSILGTDEYLWTISDEKISDIKSREQDGVVILSKGKMQFQKGDPILIDEGDFSGWEGIFQEELPDRQRAVILLTNIQYSSKLIIPIKFLVKNA